MELDLGDKVGFTFLREGAHAKKKKTGTKENN